MVNSNIPAQEITVQRTPPMNQEIEDIRKETLLLVGHASTHTGPIQINKSYNEHQTHHIERLIGRMVIRKLNKIERGQ